MNSVGELISLNTKLINIKNIVESDIRLSGCGKNIGKITAFLDKLTEQLYNQMLSIRMMPVRSLFNKFKSVIETLSVEQHKKIEVNIKGERTEIDRVVLESLRDPLIHLIRNAVDHGVESPEVRISKGKSPEGHVNLRAFNDVNSVVIEIEDDGKGMDPDKILSKAIEKGLIDPMEAGGLSRREIFQIIFAPGFSTAEQVTSLSGRGVGMDVVRTTVERHGGNILIQTEKEKGSCFKIRLPLAMSMVDTLIVRSGGAIFAIPSEGIVRILKTPRSAFKTIFEKSVLPMNGNTIPFRRLSAIFDEYCEDDPTKSHVLTAIIKSENRPLALGLDEIIGKQKVVIKNIGKFLGNVKGISGAYIQGDGKIILVINIRDVCNVKVQDAV
jgi:two-component system chemotaxis sensor kinase CheA